MRVVALGSSAAGLAAIRAILAKLPSDCGMALVVIEHLDPARRSLDRDLLSKATPFPVIEISNGVAVQPNHVYVVPPNKSASIRNGKLSLGSITNQHRHHPIDAFMTSLAAERREAAIGIVLSGRGTDGTRGLAAIKAASGITFAQDPKTAQWPAMPLSAIKAGGVDFVLSPAGIALELGRLGRYAENDVRLALLQSRGSLVESESIVHALLDASPQAIFAVNASGTIAWVNGTTAKMFGYESSELRGQPLDLLVPGPYGKRHAARRASSFANLRHRPLSRGLELQARRKDGTLFPVEIGLNFTETQAGILGLAFVTDITERKQLYQSIRQHESELAALFDSSPDPHLRFDSNLRVTHANAAYVKMAGVSAREIIGKTGRELPLPQGDVQVVERLIKNVMRTGQPNQLELSVPSTEGVSVHEIRYVPEISPDGSAVAVLAIGRDITERKRMERALRQREQELAALFDNSPDLIVRLDRNLRNLYVNAAWERLTGISRETALGKTSEELGLPPATVKLEKRGIRQVLKTRSPLTIEFTYPSPNGPVDHEVRHIPEFDNGSVSSILLIGRDITEQKRLQRLAAANERDIRALSASLINAQEQERRRVAREIHDSLCQHLGILAAEIGGVATRFPASSPAGQGLWAARERALRTAEEARQIASQLHPAILEDLGLPKALQNLCREFSQREGVPVKLRVVDRLPEAPLDVGSCVYRIAQEALHNVAKHAHAKSIWVTLSGTGNLHLSICDDGIGFDPDAVRGAGGLGLVSMQERARIAGAKLSIQGRPGHGTCVDLTVPIRGATRGQSAHSAGR